jgi:transcriptional regulator with XRE-family HTH domain
MPAANETGARIRRARKLARLTQQQLAEKVGVSRGTVDAWENGRAYPRRFDVALEQALGISLGGEAAPAQGLAAGDMWDGQPLDQWEAAVLADPDLPEEVRCQLVRDSRAARAAYSAERQARRSRAAGPPAGQAGGRTGSGEAARSDRGRTAG